MDIRVKEAIKKTFLLYRQPIDKVIKKAHIAEDLIKKDFMNDQQNTFNKKNIKNSFLRFKKLSRRKRKWEGIRR